MCSSTRGPAIAPSFVTWPMRNSAVPPRLAKRVSCAAHSRTCATEPGADCSVSDHSVWIESITAMLGPRRLERAEHALELRLGGNAHPRGVEREAPRAQRDLLGRFFAGHIEHRLRERAQSLQQQRGLADARIAAEQHHLPCDQPAAERAVELADAGRHALQVARLYIGKRDRRRRCAVAPPRRGRSTVSVSVPAAPHEGQAPNHCSAVAPHSVQT